MKYEQPLGIAEHEQLKHRKKIKKNVSNEQHKKIINTQKNRAFLSKVIVVFFYWIHSLDFILLVACLFVEILCIRLINIPN